MISELRRRVTYSLWPMIALPLLSMIRSAQLRSSLASYSTISSGSRLRRLVIKVTMPSMVGSKRTLGGDATASGYDLKAVIAIQITGMSVSAASMITTLARIAWTDCQPGSTLSTRAE